MTKKNKLKSGYKNLTKPLYLNANLIYSEALNYIKKTSWNRTIKTGTLTKLKSEGYQLVTSIMTRMEVIQRMIREENKTEKTARKIYNFILEDHEILEITSIHKHIALTNAFFDNLARSNLDFKDALHLMIAKNLNEIPVCTHDKKLRGDFSQHTSKQKFYDKIFKPQELIKSKK